MTDFFSDDLMTISIRLVTALLAGGIIGLERTYNGRPAGFRTHSLVCMSSSLLMLLTVFQWKLLEGVPIETIRVDPTRMGQGIMTGIGFLGAGVIMKERFSVRGLTTAASIWVTASIGILLGMGFFSAAAVATLLALGTLSVFRWFESVLPSLQFARLSVRTLRRSELTEDELLAVVNELGMTCSTSSYYLEGEGKYIRYEMTVYSRKTESFRQLANALSEVEQIQEFHVIPRAS